MLHFIKFPHTRLKKKGGYAEFSVVQFCELVILREI